MNTIDWLNERINAGEALLGQLLHLSAGPARRSGDLHSPELVDVRSFLSDFAKWDSANRAGLSRLFHGEPAWVEQYMSIKHVDRQLAMTDFMPQKTRIETCLVGKLDELRAIRESVVRRVVPSALASGCVFIGHGRSPLWRELKDYIVETLGLEFEEFERQPVAGLPITERLDEMLRKSQFAVIVMTGEDLHHDGSSHARENVIHEIGLFQGKLGRSRVVVLMEEGCEEFSNIKGVVIERFPKGLLRAAYEGVRGALVREGLLSNPANAA